MQPQPNDWKSQLARNVFDWLSHASVQLPGTSNYPAREPKPEFYRNVGWMDAAQIVTGMFTHKGWMGVPLILANEVEGPTSRWLQTDETIPFRRHQFVHPEDILMEIWDRLKKREMYYVTQDQGGDFFHSAGMALRLSAQDVQEILQGICMHVADSDEPSYECGDPAVYEPGWYYYRCKKCHAKVPTFVELGIFDVETDS